MFPVKRVDLINKLLIGAWEIQPFHILSERKITGYLFIHALQSSLFLQSQVPETSLRCSCEYQRNFPTCSSPAFSKSPRSCDQRHLRPGRLKKFSDQSCFINIVIPVSADFHKIRNPDRNIHTYHFSSLLSRFSQLFC